MLALYIHIPFCESKCKYCDFTSFRGNEETIEEYIMALNRELEIYSEKIKDEKIRTIFFGGGTPSSIKPKYIYSLMENIYKNYRTEDLGEISLESNPGSIDTEKAKIYRQAGINRISMGAQSFNNEILRSIGRSHSEKDIYRSLDILRDQGFENINLDLMHSLPNQSLEDMILSIEKASSLKIPHISNYSLILEEGTGLYREYLEGKYQVLDEKLDREMYKKSREALKARGYGHYEISNFAKAGHECLHNLVYWNIEPYLGLGLSSHSNYRGERFSNSLNIRDYIGNLSQGRLAVVEREKISNQEEIAEYAIMGFRKISGIDKNKFKERFQLNFDNYYFEEIKKNLEAGLLINEKNRVCLSEKGLDLLGQVELDFYKI